MNRLVFVRVVETGGGAETNLLNLTRLIFNENKVDLKIFTLADYVYAEEGIFNKIIAVFRFILDVRKASTGSLAILSNVEGYPYILVFISTLFINVKKILWLHSNPFTYLNKISFRQRVLIKSSLIIAKKIICASPVASRYNLIKNKEIIFLPNFIDYGLVSKKLSLNKSTITKFVFIGSFSEFKRPFLAIDIFMLILNDVKCSTEFTLDFFGDGPIFNEVKNYAEGKGELSRLIKFHGHVDVPWEELQDNSILISTSSTEALPMIFVEAVFRGIPVFCNNYHGSNFFTEHNGLIFSCNVTDSKESLDLIKYIINISDVDFQSRLLRTNNFLNTFFNNSQNFTILYDFCLK